MDNQSLNDFLNFDFQNFADYLANLPPLELGAIGGVVGLLLCLPLTMEKQNSLGNFFELVGQAMLVVGSQQAVINKSQAQSSGTNYPNNQQMQQMQDQINQLNQKISEILWRINRP